MNSMIEYFNHIIGNEPVKEYLARLLKKNTFSHSLLFAGKDGIGKGLFAEAFAKAVICANDPTGSHKLKLDACIHPDLRFFRPEGKSGMHSIDSMRQFSDEVHLAPYEADKKIFIIYDAERMFSYSANALLKTFEEPAPHSLIILITQNPTSLLPTVLSRCCTFHFKALSDHNVSEYFQNTLHKSPQEADAIAAVADGSIGNALRLVERGGDQLRHKILQVLQKGKLANYMELLQFVHEISAQVQAGQEQLEEKLRATLKASLPEDLSLVQQQDLEKEVDGAIAMQTAHEAYAIFNVILSWYRDLHLIQAKGNPSYLLNRDLEQEYTSKRNALFPLEDVQKYISQARLGLERSLPLDSCLETLFLKLELL